ncbi:MAG: hypothetical protein EOO47_12285 [Flavobacterium sp.]|nr:MAG: hypothetical protein EOO47_12285 [Flavobacterium sp.]
MKSKLAQQIGLSLIVILIWSCNFNSTFINREEDKEDAEKIAEKFYGHLQKRAYSKLHALISERFWKTTSDDKLDDFLTSADDKLGPIKSKTLDHWETKIIKGTQSSSTYVLYYLVQREKHQSKETLTLTKEDGKIKILGYNLNSEGIFK